ncbi:MAG: pilus assembly protein TadG-related protein [Paracoccaceae bacterium]
MFKSPDSIIPNNEVESTNNCVFIGGRQMSVFGYRIHIFLEREDGAMTALGLFLFLASVVIGGLAIDVASAMMARTQLQVAADAAAHAAIYSRQLNSASTAKTAALNLANANMPSAHFGSLLTESDIRFGYWNATTQQFEVDANSRDAVLVDMSRLASKSNSVGTYFLRFAGFNEWDIRVSAVFETYLPTCFREGFVAALVVDIQSNNTYKEGFCIHSNTHVELNQNNYFENGTIVSMPDKNNLVLPASGFSNNIGLQFALRDGSYRIRILNWLEEIIDDLESAGPNYTPSYISGTGIIMLSSNIVDAGDFTTGRVHKKTCSGNQKLTIKQGTTLENIVLVTDCVIKFGNNVTLENVVIATRNTDVKSITASHVQIGRDDNCAEDGGSQILTLGGFSAASGLQIYGGQIIALKDIDFAAQADGIEGASFIAGERIDGTSNMIMGFCGSGMERNFRADYFRLAG